MVQSCDISPSSLKIDDSTFQLELVKFPRNSPQNANFTHCKSLQDVVCHILCLLWFACASFESYLNETWPQMFDNPCKPQANYRSFRPRRSSVLRWCKHWRLHLQACWRDGERKRHKRVKVMCLVSLSLNAIHYDLKTSLFHSLFYPEVSSSFCLSHYPVLLLMLASPTCPQPYITPVSANMGISSHAECVGCCGHAAVPECHGVEI